MRSLPRGVRDTAGSSRCRSCADAVGLPRSWSSRCRAFCFRVPQMPLHRSCPLPLHRYPERNPPHPDVSPGRACHLTHWPHLVYITDRPRRVLAVVFAWPLPSGLMPPLALVAAASGSSGTCCRIIEEMLPHSGSWMPHGYRGCPSFACQEPQSLAEFCPWKTESLPHLQLGGRSVVHAGAVPARCRTARQQNEGSPAGGIHRCRGPHFPASRVLQEGSSPVLLFYALSLAVAGC